MMAIRIKSVLIMMVLMTIDIGPVPVTAMIGLFIVVTRPTWFRQAIESIYDYGK